MNEKIRELYKQSKPDNWIDLQTLYGELPALSGDQVENFAKLIIQECLDILNPYKVEIGGEHFSHPAAGEIRKHFGVEE